MDHRLVGVDDAPTEHRHRHLSGAHGAPPHGSRDRRPVGCSIDASSAASKSAWPWWVRPWVRAREKLAMTPWLRASRPVASSRVFAGEGGDAHVRVRHEVAVYRSSSSRQGELEHDRHPVHRSRPPGPQQGRPQPSVGWSTWVDDRDEPRGEDRATRPRTAGPRPRSHRARSPTRTERTCPEHAVVPPPVRARHPGPRHRLRSPCTPSALSARPPVHLEEGHDVRLSCHRYSADPC